MKSLKNESLFEYLQFNYDHFLAPLTIAQINVQYHNRFPPKIPKRGDQRPQQGDEPKEREIPFRKEEIEKSFKKMKK